jgi:hypothetical protein
VLFLFCQNGYQHVQDLANSICLVLVIFWFVVWLENVFTIIMRSLKLGHVSTSTRPSTTALPGSRVSGAREFLVGERGNRDFFGREIMSTVYKRQGICLLLRLLHVRPTITSIHQHRRQFLLQYNSHPPKDLHRMMVENIIMIRRWINMQIMSTRFVDERWTIGNDFWHTWYKFYINFYNTLDSLQKFAWFVCHTYK